MNLKRIAYLTIFALAAMLLSALIAKSGYVKLSNEAARRWLWFFPLICFIVALIAKALVSRREEP